ncbi:unnamed protein product [Thlaspi arvense]|uniref:Uncharacterized protein n=1 Tax=Thlaspi arvense TaxID=13288 RepID=A0AAU9RNK5_THLAR|nr:unnamed protein product [Thlaspi arvense]
MAALKGYIIIMTIPFFTSLERRVIMRSFGAELVLTDPAKEMGGTVKKAYDLLENTPYAHMLQQFANPANTQIHYDTTGPKIWEDTLENVDIFVMGIGNGGTISGVGQYLKSKNPNIKIYGVEPAKSNILNRGKPDNIDIGVVLMPDEADTLSHFHVSKEETDKLVSEVIRIVLFKSHQNSGCSIKREDLTQIVTKNYRQRNLATYVINEAKRKLSNVFCYDLKQIQRSRPPSTGQTRLPQSQSKTVALLIKLFMEKIFKPAPFPLELDLRNYISSKENPEYGETSLHMAAKNGRNEAAKLLLHRGAFIEAKASVTFVIQLVCSLAPPLCFSL